MAFKDQTDCGEEVWMENLDKLAFLAYEDQCSPCNPRVPMLEDIKKILVESYNGTYQSLDEEKKAVKAAAPKKAVAKAPAKAPAKKAAKKK